MPEDNRELVQAVKALSNILQNRTSLVAMNMSGGGQVYTALPVKDGRLQVSGSFNLALDQYIHQNGTIPLTANWDAGSYQIRASTFYSDVATGTAPLTIVSETLVGHLNVDFLDGYHATAFEAAGAVSAHTGTYNHGLLHANTNDPTADEKAGIAGASGTNPCVLDDDPRLGQQRVCFGFWLSGECAVGSKIGPINFYGPCAFSITKIHAGVDTAPTGASLIVDVNLNGTTIFTTQGNRPTIAAGAKSATSGTPEVTAVAENDVLTFDIDQIGSTTPGVDLLIQVRGTIP